MKRLQVIILVLILPLMLGCSEYGTEKDPFFYQEDFASKICMNLGDQKTEYTYTNQDGVKILVFYFPENLRGYRFIQNDDGIFMSYGSVVVPANEEMSLIMNITTGMFSLSETSVVSVKTEKSSDKSLTKITAGGVDVWQDSENGLPVKISGVLFEVEFSADITEFSLENNQDF